MQSSIQLLIFIISLTYLDVCDRYGVIFWTAFFVFAILQSVVPLDQKNVYYEIKPRDRYASTTITYYIIEKLFGI